MDLPTCPACGQSVLDDDAEDCPFCGASMSGKPSAGKPSAGTAVAPKKPAARKQAAGKAGAAADREASAESPRGAGAKPAGAGARRASASAESDDPFDGQEKPAVKAILLQPAPRPGRQWEVVCPMCETSGYTSTKASGREVRCANSSCMVPVFTAPEYEAPVAPPEPAPEKARWPIVMGATLAGCAVVAGVGYFLLFYGQGADLSEDVLNQPIPRQAPPTTAGTETEPETVNPLAGNPLDPPATNDGNGTKDPEPQLQLPDGIVPLLVEEARRAPQNAKPACRRLVAEACALLGQLDAAQEQLDQLDKVRRGRLEFYRIPPLVQIALRQQAAGDNAAAKKSLDDALQAAAGLTKFGRVPLDWSTRLSGALVAAGRAAEAATLIGQHHNEEFLGRFSASLQLAWATQSFNCDRPTGMKFLLPLQSPQRAAVTGLAALQGDPQHALEWARGAGDATSRIESLALWAEMQVLRSLNSPVPVEPEADESAGAAADAADSDEAEAGPQVTARGRQLMQVLGQAAAGLSPQEQAVLYARSAARLAHGGQAVDAALPVQRARQLLAEQTPPAELKLPGLREVQRRFKLPEEHTLWRSAFAQIELARAEVLLGNREAAWQAVQKALTYPRGMAPSPVAVASLSRTSQQQLATALEVTTADQSRIEFTEFRRKMELISRRTRVRTELQQSLMSAALDWGLAVDVWNELSSRSSHSDPALQESWGTTSLVLRTADALQAAGQTEQAKAAEQLGEQALELLSPAEQVRLTTDRQVAAGDATAAMQQIEQASGGGIDRMWKTQRAMELAGRLAAGKLTSASVRFATASSDPLLREDCLELLAAQLALAGTTDELWSLMQTMNLSHTEKAATGAGLAAGFSARKPTAPAAVAPEQAAVD